MDLGILHEVCKSATKKHYAWFKHRIEFPVLEVNHSYIEACYNDMMIDIKCQINKKCFVDPGNPKQYAVKLLVENNYLTIVEQYAWKYGLKAIV